MSSTVVNSVELVRMLIEQIENSSLQPPFIFLDLEGVKLSRQGSIAILQVLIAPINRTFLLDVHILREHAFETPSPSGLTLKAILESNEICKVFFDVRRDSDALFAHFRVSLHGVVDLQLLEFATRRVTGKYLQGLSKCISEDAGLTWKEKQESHEIKEAGLTLFLPERGGRYVVFQERPMPKAIVDYCVQDVAIMPKLLMVYAGKIQHHLASRVHIETVARITLSQSPSFSVEKFNMALGPSLMGISSKHEPPFPMSIVCSEKVTEYCSLK